ncbi:MAG: hypothetical protein SFT90_08345 [Rickettsiales bacterium]|nr:hypothetical protein [Rickettsiales bacterium]
MINYFENPQIAIWLIIGVIFIVLEVFTFAGIGFITAGLGAITLGALLAFKFLDSTDILENIAYFLFFTIMWWVILWRPLIKSIKAKSTDYNSFKGTNAIIDNENGLEIGKIGYVRWSGTRMRARINPNSTQSFIADKESVWVIENKNGILIIDTTEPKN